MQSATPEKLLLPVWPLSISLATTLEISVDFFSSPYLDVSVQAVSPAYLCIQYTVTEVCSVGLLHSEIHGSIRTYRSPWLIAACHVLRRLLMPRHSPCALFSLTSSRQSPLRSVSAASLRLPAKTTLRFLASPLRAKPACAGLCREEITWFS